MKAADGARGSENAPFRRGQGRPDPYKVAGAPRPRIAAVSGVASSASESRRTSAGQRLELAEGQPSGRRWPAGRGTGPKFATGGRACAAPRGLPTGRFVRVIIILGPTIPQSTFAMSSEDEHTRMGLDDRVGPGHGERSIASANTAANAIRPPRSSRGPLGWSPRPIECSQGQAALEHA